MASTLEGTHSGGKLWRFRYRIERRLGAWAGFKRNEQILAMAPRYVIAFPGTGVAEHLVIEVEAILITVVDRRGPLATKPGVGLDRACWMRCGGYETADCVSGIFGVAPTRKSALVRIGRPKARQFTRCCAISETRHD